MEIIPVTGRVANWYLLRAERGFVMVDCGAAFGRGRQRRVLREHGCGPGDIRLLVVTHADLDHAGNGAWLQQEFRAPIALHPAELPAVTGNMFDNRARKVNAVMRGIVGAFSWWLAKPFVPDVLLDEETDLREYGLDARTVFIPGHSQGSIGVLTGDGDLFCGDLLNNAKGTPVKNWLVDVPEDMDASVARLDGLGVRTVYPGHGEPFTWADFKRA